MVHNKLIECFCSMSPSLLYYTYLLHWLCEQRPVTIGLHVTIFSHHVLFCIIQIV